MLLIFEGVDRSGKTTAIANLIKENKVDFLIKFSNPEAHGGKEQLYNEYENLALIALTLGKTRKLFKFKIFDRYLFSEIAYSKVFRNSDYNKKFCTDISQELLAKQDVLIVLFDICYETYRNRGGSDAEFTMEQFNRLRKELLFAVTDSGVPYVIIQNDIFQFGKHQLDAKLYDYWKGDD